MSGRGFAEARRLVLRERGRLTREAASAASHSLVDERVPVLAPPGGVGAPLPVGRVSLVEAVSVPSPDWQAMRERAAGLFDVDGPRLGFAEAIARAEPDRALWNGAAYRLVSARRSNDGLELAFGAGSYFEAIDTCEVLAHEWAARPAAPLLRALHTDPFRFETRSGGLAVSALTIVRGSAGDRCFLIRRAPDVAVAPNMIHVVPAGEFQPGRGRTVDFAAADFDLVAIVGRELAEELGGTDEDASTSAALRRLVDTSRARLWVWDVTLDALTYKPELLCALVLDEAGLAECVGAIVRDGPEGEILADAVGAGVSFDRDTVEAYVASVNTVSFAAAILGLAWRDRQVLLD